LCGDDNFDGTASNLGGEGVNRGCEGKKEVDPYGQGGKSLRLDKDNESKGAHRAPELVVLNLGYYEVCVTGGWGVFAGD